MLDGVVRFPPEFAARYRAKGYWEDRSLAAIFGDVFKKYADRVAIIDRDAVGSGGNVSGTTLSR